MGLVCGRLATRDNFQTHHQPFNYFVQFGPGTAERKKRLRDAGTIIVSSYARRGEVDHNVYDTGSSCGFSSRRFGLPKLPGLIAREKAMIDAGGIPPGDLTNCLRFA